MEDWGKIPGPKLSLTMETIEAMADIVRDGNFRYVAAGRLGIPKDTLASWLQRGRGELADYAAGILEDLTLKAHLVTELEKAEAECHVVLIRGAASRWRFFPPACC